MAPNGKVSNLNEKQYKQVRSEAFKAWFGDWENNPESASQVVDANGEPLVVYHGTRSDIFFDKFNTGSFFTDSLLTAEAFNQEATHRLMIDGEVHLIDQDTYRSIVSSIEPYDSDYNITGYNLNEDFNEQLNSELEHGGIQIGIDEISSESEVFVEAIDTPIYQVFLNLRNPKIKDYKGKTWGENDTVIEHDLERGKYDGFIAKNIREGGLVAELPNGEEFPISTTFVTFNANQIKSATDNSGAFDGGNDSILYQEGFDAELQQATTKDSLQVENKNASGVIDVTSIRGVLGKELEFVGDSVAQEAYLQKMLPVIESTRAFGRELEQLKNGKANGFKPLLVSKTPNTLIKVGAEQLDIVVDESIIKKMIEKHGLTYEQIKMLPIALNQPIMVFDSATDKEGNSLVVLVELLDSKKNHVVVAIGLDVNRGVKYQVNVIKSAYGRNNQASAISSWIHDGLLKYEHKKRTQLFSNRTGLQLPKHLKKSSNGTIHDESGFVKLEMWEKIIKSAKNSKNHEIFYQNAKNGSSIKPKVDFYEALKEAEKELATVDHVLNKESFYGTSESYSDFMSEETQGGVMGYIIQHGIKIPRPVKGSHGYIEYLEAWNRLPEKYKKNASKERKDGFERVMNDILLAMDNEGLISSSTNLNDLIDALNSDHKIKKSHILVHQIGAILAQMRP